MVLRAVERVDENFPGVVELREKIGPEFQPHSRGWLGINRRLGVRVNRPLLVRALFYVPDRVMDVLDLVTFDVHLGFGLFANVRATRAMQAGAGFRSTLGVGLHEQRSLGVANESEIGAHGAMLGLGTMSGVAVGVPARATSGSGSIAGVHTPYQPIYQEYRDYYAFGASATALFFGVSVELHPLQVLDFAGGFLLLDFARDDLATTRPLRLDSNDIGLLESLNEIEQSGVWEGTPFEDLPIE